MLRKAVYLVVAMAISAIAATIVCHTWNRMPWRTYVARCELCHLQRVNGIEHASFAGNRWNESTYEYLHGKCASWTSEAFRENILLKMSGNEDIRSRRKCLFETDIEIQNQHACIIVCSKSSSSNVVVECANAFARAIVSDFEREERHRRQQEVRQMRANFDKHIRNIQNLDERLKQGAGNAEKTKQELQRKRLLTPILEREIESLEDEKEWIAALKPINYAEDNVKVVPPNPPTVYGCSLLFGFGGWLLICHRIHRRHRNLYGTIDRKVNDETC